MSVGLAVSDAELRSQASRRLRVIWKDPDSRRNHQVGWLEKLPDETYIFSYLAEDALPQNFEPFLQFPEVGRDYCSEQLPAFFRNRVMNRQRESAVRYLHWIGVENDDQLEEISRTGGVRVTDSISVVDSFDLVNGHCEGHFLVSGLQHQNALSYLDQLCAGAELRIEDEADNSYNPRAMLLTHDGVKLGWIPNWLVDEVHRLRDQGLVQVFVEQVNRDAPSHLALLCKLVANIRSAHGS